MKPTTFVCLRSTLLILAETYAAEAAALKETESTIEQAAMRADMALVLAKADPDRIQDLAVRGKVLWILERIATWAAETSELFWHHDVIHTGQTVTYSEGGTKHQKRCQPKMKRIYVADLRIVAAWIRGEKQRPSLGENVDLLLLAIVPPEQRVAVAS